MVLRIGESPRDVACAACAHGHRHVRCQVPAFDLAFSGMIGPSVRVREAARALNLRRPAPAAQAACSRESPRERTAPLVVDPVL